jgi:hypothetical protein
VSPPPHRPVPTRVLVAAAVSPDLDGGLRLFSAACHPGQLFTSRDKDTAMTLDALVTPGRFSND